MERPSGPSVPAKSIVAGMQGVRVLPPGAEISLAKRPVTQAAASPEPAKQHVSMQQQFQQQPTYVNMHELASMAASKAQYQQQDKSLPPPPAEFISPPEKVSNIQRHLWL